MILTCSSCEKKFVVPDKAITVSGRTVQCGSCGNKWKQFPIENETKNVKPDKKINIRKPVSIAKTSKPRKKKVKTTREINLYSPEYLAKKHGIHLDNLKDNNGKKSTRKITFGFYNSLIVFIVVIITLSKSLYFFQDIIVQQLPLSEFYINYFFESIKNIFEIIKNLIFSY
jgi:predicted Zn finger-like uncharacterized protein|tara:strand:- start:440 stop:952 length:513 start_codon:yes stop_codon:yes gene_type:complete